MRRFSSLKYNPAETRRILRDRFVRYLPSHNTSTCHSTKEITLSDESLLQLLLNLSIDFGSDFKREITNYIATLTPNSNEPKLEDLLEAGWFDVVWGRFSTPIEVVEAARKSSAGTMTKFIAILEKRHDQIYHVRTLPDNDAEFANAVNAINDGELTPRNIGCQTPTWVAARLWDRTWSSSIDHSATLRSWVDRWQQLDCPLLVPKSAWNEASANTFREAAFNVLDSELKQANWHEICANFVKQMALVNKQYSSSLEEHLSSVATTLVDHVLWLDNHMHEAQMRILNKYEDILGIVHLMLADVVAENHAQAPHKTANRLFALALERAELFVIVLFYVSRNAVLLVDLLLYPETSALACLRIAQWQFSTSASDRELVDRDNQTMKTIAFADAVSVMGYFLEHGKVDPKEAASLLDWFHKYAKNGFIGDLGNSELMLTTLRGELVHQSPDTLRTMVDALSTSTPRLGLGTSNFAAALDIVDTGILANDINPTPLVEAYVQSVATGNHSLSANRVSINAAATLFKLVKRTSLELQQNFLRPIDIGEQLATDTANSIFVVVRSVRAHIRVLCRAVDGWVETAPDDLTDALIDAVRTGALKHVEKGRVAAFSPRYDSGAFGEPLDRPIAADIGAAISALKNNHRENLLAAVLETDEPTVLAQLLAFTPYTTRERIKQRITELTPIEAGEIYSLTEAQARIEALLSAELGDVAELFIKIEQDLETLGPVAGREMNCLRTTLRLHLLREEWDSITNTSPPSEFSHAERQSAIELIDFYKALAALKNPKGDWQAAEQIFAQLQSRHPNVIAYTLNLFVTRIHLLLGDDLFKQLDDTAITLGRRVLAELDEMMTRVFSMSDIDEEIYYCNKALILLALGQPKQASELLMSIRTTRLQDTVAAYNAVALARLEHDSEAIDLLDQTEKMLGNTVVLCAARKHIQQNKSLPVIPNYSQGDDQVCHVKAALFDLKQMEPNQQARVLQPLSQSFEEFVIDIVRLTGASVMSLVPMMKGITIDSSEDDLSALIREFLVARVSHFAWSVSDQSKGGFTAKENPGERDIVLKKNSSEIAVIEAVVCKQSVSRGNLVRHFQKLFAYSSCCLFFHLTYAYTGNPESILRILQEIAEVDAPDNFSYINRVEIPHTDSRPVGFTACYSSALGTVKVVFLILDMLQRDQRNAAKIAG